MNDPNPDESDPNAVELNLTEGITSNQFHNNDTEININDYVKNP